MNGCSRLWTWLGRGKLVLVLKPVDEQDELERREQREVRLRPAAASFLLELPLETLARTTLLTSAHPHPLELA